VRSDYDEEAPYHGHRYVSYTEKAAQKRPSHFLIFPHAEIDYQCHNQQSRPTSMMNAQGLPQVISHEFDACQDGLQCGYDRNNLPEACHIKLEPHGKIPDPYKPKTSSPKLAYAGPVKDYFPASTWARLDFSTRKYCSCCDGELGT